MTNRDSIPISNAEVPSQGKRYIVREGKLYIEGLSTVPVLIAPGIEDICDWLNNTVLAERRTELILKNLLHASLDTNRGLEKAQDAAAKRLRYPGLQGFIDEIIGHT